MHHNKSFSKADYEKYNPIAVAKILEYFRYCKPPIEAYAVAEQKQHWDVIAKYQHDDGTEVVTDEWRIEGECRREHYDDVYAGKYDDVHFPKRKFYTNCDGPNERRDLPHFILCMSADPNDLRFIVVDRNAIERGLPHEKRHWNRETKRDEPFVPIRKEDCYRYRIVDGRMVSEGTVADALELMDAADI